MEFWGKEVKPGATVSCKVDEGLVIHLSQAALGEQKKASENVIMSLKTDDKKVVLGTLSVEKHPQISCDLVFDKDFELSHNSKTASVFFCGYTSPLPYESVYGEDSSDEELETDQIPAQNNETKISAAVAKVPAKGGIKDESSSDDDEDFTDSEMSDEDDSSDEDELSSGTDPSDDSSDDSDDSSSEEQTAAPKKTDVVVGKKRAIEAEAPAGKKAKSEQSAQKTGDKKVSTHSAKQSSKTPADKSMKTPTADKKSPKSGSHACKTCNKSFSSASGLESHQKAKKHEA